MTSETGHKLVESHDSGFDPRAIKREVRRLVTPKSVSEYRAKISSKANLPKGVILDPAAGSGGQLLAYSKYLDRPCAAVELSPQRADFCAYQFSRASDNCSVITICGDGTDAQGVMSIVESKTGQTSICMLHVDPARPMDTQKHAVSEMQPSLSVLLESWSEYIHVGPDGPAMTLDLSPRLARQQMLEIEDIVLAVFPRTSMTWEWLSRGGGRVDRLCLQTGPLADIGSASRSVRLWNDGSFSTLHDDGDILDASDMGWSDYKLCLGDLVALIDPVIPKSGLGGVFEECAGYARGELVWIGKSERRPLALLHEEIHSGSEVRPFVVAQGVVVGRMASKLDLMSIDSLASLAMENNIATIQVRCSLEPRLHKRITDRLRQILGQTHGSPGFLIEDGGSEDLVLCKELEV